MEILPEVEVWYGLPAIRKSLALELKKAGLTQRSIAEKLGIAESAVSQYVSGKRGNTELPKELRADLQKASKAIIAGADAKSEQMQLVNLMRDSRAICDIHKQHADDVPDGCTTCFD